MLYSILNMQVLCSKHEVKV